MTLQSQPPMPRADWGLFFDIDGTLLEIAPTPDAVTVGNRVLTILEALQKATGGAVALISGRPLIQIDNLFAPLRFPASGLHGLEIRLANGELRQPPPPREDFQRMRAGLDEFAAAHPELLFEDKGYLLALHYRRAPELGPLARAKVSELIGKWGKGYSLLAGKMVFEIKPSCTDKGRAIETFMSTEPFAGRCPLYVGDDTTDENAFAVVNQRGGHLVHVGSTPETLARHTIADVPKLLDWLMLASKQMQT